MNEPRPGEPAGAGWFAAALLAFAWGLIPLAPAVFRGEIPGSPWTDLYPAVWGLGWFARHAAEGLPAYAPELAAPAGMPFYYSSPLHGWLAVPLVPAVGLPLAYTIGVAAARIATVLCAYGAGRALGLKGAGALVLAAVYGCAPFFHGYAVEGIVEGTDGWTLALWVWMAARQRWAAASVAAALVVLSSWYLAMVGVLAALVALPFSWRASASFGVGLAAASPALLAFLSSFSGGRPLDPAVRAQMGTPFTVFPAPGVLEGTWPFAKTSWLGWIAPILAAASARKHPKVAAIALVAWLLSTGIGPWWDLPVWRAVRFPYRLHAGTLLAVGWLAGRTVDERIKEALAPAMAVFIVIEGLLMSPVEPILPGAPADVPEAFRALRGSVVLSIPGPVSMPPGQINPSRPRSRHVLYWSEIAGTRTPWAPDFNNVGASGVEAPVLAAARTWDGLHQGIPEAFGPEDLRSAGIDAIVIHSAELPRARVDGLAEAFGPWIVHRDEALIVARGW